MVIKRIYALFAAVPGILQKLNRKVPFVKLFFKMIHNCRKCPQGRQVSNYETSFIKKQKLHILLEHSK